MCQMAKDICQGRQKEANDMCQMVNDMCQMANDICQGTQKDSMNISN